MKKEDSVWVLNEFQTNIWNNKYKYEEENLEKWFDRISNNNKEVKQLMKDKKFLFAGRILANRGLDKLGKKVTYSNCYVLSKPEDNIESIFNTAKKLARTFSYGGGVGIDISNLRPKGAKVNNAAVTTTGAVSFMELFNLTTDIIGQKGRRGALMLSMDCSHPDIEDFINIKTDLQKVTKANISVRVNDKFMKAVEEDTKYKCGFICEDTGELILKQIDAKKIFMKMCENNWDFAEPGILFWDNIEKNNLLSEDKDFKYAGINPCAEEPLPAGGSCLLGSINLSEFVINKFEDNAEFDINEFKKVVRISTRALNDVLEEGLELHPLEEQRKSVSEYRQIGLGVMGIADMLIKLGIKYGSYESLVLCDKIARELLVSSFNESIKLAKERGAYEKINIEAIKKSSLYQLIKDDINEEDFNKYGIRNSQLLTIPPTGSISNLIGVSGGIEPIFNISYTRKTESLHDEDVFYKVYTPIVKEYMNINDMIDDNDLPDIFETAMTLKPEERIKMQAAWQKYIDASISSTINLPHEATVEDVYNTYMLAWKNKLKGITVYRDGCKRSGILLNDKADKKNKKNKKEEKIHSEEVTNLEDGVEEFICPECGNKTIVPTGGCAICLQCGYSKCN